MTDKVAIAENLNNFVEEIYELLFALRDGGVLDNHDVNFINSSIRYKFNDWCLENLTGEEYVDFVLKLLDDVKEKLENEIHY